jgi:hypothetical protein
MATWNDVRRIATSMPDVTERLREGVVDWRDKLFVWERPLRKTDIAALGPSAPSGPILAARVPDLGAKEALLASDGTVYFTTPHFNGYPAILVRLEHIEVGELEELIVEAWHARARRR